MSKLFRRFIAAGTTAVMLAAVPLTGNAAAERFTDVKPGAWYYTAVLERYPDGGMVSGYARYAMEWAVTHDIIKGSGGKLNPKGTATRAQVAQIFYNSRELLEDGGEEPKPPSPSPSPSPSPDPDTPRISITDEVRAKLRPNQNPEQILNYVLHGKHDDPTFTFDGTTAKWDPSLIYADDVARKYLGNWEDSENEIHGSAPVANGFIQMLTRTASDRFFITAKAEDGSFCMYYHPAETVDSQKMKEVKRLLNLPSTVKSRRSAVCSGTVWICKGTRLRCQAGRLFYRRSDGRAADS